MLSTSTGQPKSLCCPRQSAAKTMKLLAGVFSYKPSSGPSQFLVGGTGRNLVGLFQELPGLDEAEVLDRIHNNNGVGTKAGWVH